MALTRKDFEELARIIGEHEARTDDRVKALDHAILRDRMMAFCALRNPAFRGSVFGAAINEARDAKLGRP